MDAQRATGRAVESVCAVLRKQGVQIAARTYRDMKQRAISDRYLEDAIVVNELMKTVDAPEGLYGRRKMVVHLRRSGLDVSKRRVDRLMRQQGMNGLVRGKKVRTTVPDPSAERAPDLLDRDFTAPAPNLRWVADFTYVRTWAGFAYVSFVIDCYSRTIVGWHVSMSKTTPLVITALRMALWRRDRAGTPAGKGLIHHSDAGSQGGFNWSSQHLEWEVCDGTSSAGCGSGDQAEAPVAGASKVPTSRRGRVLGADRKGSACGGSRGGRRRGAGGRCAVVPQGWRHAAIRHQTAAFGQVSVVH
nr:IS3 family transposase [Demequina sp. NBRC 110051]